MAAQGLRDVGDGEEKIANPVEAARLRMRARRINGLVLLTGIAAAGTVVAAMSF